MASWTAIADSVLEVGKPVRSIDHFALRDNVTAAFEKAAGAPVLANSYVVTAMLADLNVTQGKLANSSVGQAQLKTASGEVSSASTGAVLTLPGGTYGFYPQIRANSGTVHTAVASIGGVDTVACSAIGTSYLTRIVLGTSGGTTMLAQQLYVQASPPYNLGDGAIPLFAFALIDNATGGVIALYVAEDPPWANNGPTDVRAQGYDKQGQPFRYAKTTRIKRADVRENPALFDDYIAEFKAASWEKRLISQQMKNADMPLIPHPFTGNDLTGKTVVLLDPVSDFAHRLAELQGARATEEDHDDLACGLLSTGRIVLDNTPLSRRCPPGVIAVAPRWKLTA